MKLTLVLLGLAALIGLSMGMSLMDYEIAKLLKTRAMQGSGSGSGSGAGRGSGSGSGAGRGSGSGSGAGRGSGSGSGSGMGSGSGSGMGYGNGTGSGAGRGSGSGSGAGRGGKGGKGDDKGERERAFSALLAFSALGAKCEILQYYIEMTVDATNFTEEDIEAGVAMVAPTLYAACPDMGKFAEQYGSSSEEAQDTMLKCMAPYGILLQCTNLFAELDTMRLIGFTNSSDDGTPESDLMVHGQPLFDVCMDIFGKAKDAEQEVEDDLEKVEEAGEKVNETRELRALLKQLEGLLANRK